MDAVIKAGLKAGPTKDYIPDSKDVLVATKLLPGIDKSKEDTVEFSVDTLKGKELAFFCLFPGHYGAMQGTVTIEGDTPKKSS